MITAVRLTLVVALIVAAALASTWAVLQQAHADAVVALSELGSSLHSISAQTAERTVVVNGNRMRLGSWTVAASVDEVISEYRSKCAAVASIVIRGWVPTLSVVAESSDGSRGFVGCVDLGAEKVDVAEFIERAQRFVDTGRLGAVGTVRYAHVRSEAAGGQTLILEVSVANLDVNALLRPPMEAEWTTRLSSLKPPRAHPVLVASEEGRSASLAVYRSDSDPESLATYYRSAIAESASTVARDIETGRPGEPAFSLLTVGVDLELLTIVVRGHRNGGALVTLLRHGGLQ